MGDAQTVKGAFTVSAYLVDCEIVRQRKVEVQLSSPSELATILGHSALDESRASIPLKQLVANKAGGRKQLATERQRFFQIGLFIDQHISQFKLGFKLLKQLKVDGILESNALRRELARHLFNVKQIDALLISRTPVAAAKRYATQCLPGKEISVPTVRSCYSRYLKAKS